MRKFITLAIVVTLSALTALAAAQSVSKGSQIIDKMTYPEIRWTVPEVGKEVQREVLDNGIIIYSMVDRRLPMVEVSALIRCGESYVPLEQMAIPDLTGTVMRSGGTTTIPPDSLNLLLESIGASLNIGIGDENAGANLSVMAGELDLGIRLLADLLRHPAFPEDKLELAKEQIKTDIKRRNDAPAPILNREFARLLYGDHPFGRILEWSYVKPVARAELVAFHDRYFAPNNLMLGITGDFDPAQVKALLQKYLGDWAKKDIVFPEIPRVADIPHPGVYQVRKDVTQSNIRMGHLGIDRDNPDRYAVAVMNFILGGAPFISHISSRVRSDEGLAYSTGSSYNINSHDLGVFYTYVQTKSATTHKAIGIMLDEIKRIRENPVSEDELAAAKDSYINRYIFDFTSASQIVGQLMNLEFNDRPRDLLRTYLDNIRKVTREDVLRVAKTYLKPENISFVIVGNPSGFEKPMDDFGPVTNIEVTEPVVE